MTFICYLQEVVLNGVKEKKLLGKKIIADLPANEIIYPEHVK